MIKHRFLVTAMTPEGKLVSSSCVDTDMIHVIQQYRDIGWNPHSVIQSSQVHADTPIRIEN